MAVNRGKKFEDVIRGSFEKIPDVWVMRLMDPVGGMAGVRNICDFIVYKCPYQYLIECKSVHGNTLPFSNITYNQWQGLLKASQTRGIKAGVICWWIDHDVTMFIPIQELQRQLQMGKKSIRFDDGLYTDLQCYPLAGKKKRIFFDYDMDIFFKEITYERAEENKLVEDIQS